MNKNSIITETWSNSDSEKMCLNGWPDDPGMKERYKEGEQCGGCSYFAPFNADYGLCCNQKSRHYLETVFEHFSCPTFVNEGWNTHSFTDTPGEF
ncbi:MAG: hypothetical protein HY961_20950 [Ignavibacteriae bacterium]|nr:hypothetical protein [Ignavibacteriota bacterium]